MALEDLLNNKLRLIPKQTKVPKDIKNLIHYIKTGTLNLQVGYHRRIVSIGIREGYIDEKLNILREE
jgi:hypothetical protein